MMILQEQVHLRALRFVQLAIAIGIEPRPERRQLLHVRRDFATPTFQFLARLLDLLRIETPILVSVKALNDVGRLRPSLPGRRREALAQLLALLRREKGDKFAVQIRLGLTTLPDQVGFLIHQRPHAFKIGLLLAQFLLQVLTHDHQAVAEHRLLLLLSSLQILQRAGLRRIESKLICQPRDRRKTDRHRRWGRGIEKLAVPAGLSKIAA